MNFRTLNRRVYFRVLLALVVSLATRQAGGADKDSCIVLQPERRAAGFATRSLWTNGVIPFEFEQDVPQIIRDALLMGMSEWEARANVDFVPHITEQNYVVVTVDECACDITNCAIPFCSFIGMVGGAQFLKVNSSSSVIRHELGHLLGLYHEHQRPDRDRYIEVDFDQIPESLHSEYKLLQVGTFLTPYDFVSVMHYAVEPFMTVLPPFDQIPGIQYLPHLEISYWDTVAVRQLYGSADCDGNGIPDDGDPALADCNENGVPDSCDHALGGPAVLDVCPWDCDRNGQPDYEQINQGAPDCNNNGIIDSCILEGPATRVFQVPLEDLLNVPSMCPIRPYNREVLPGGEGKCILYPGVRWFDLHPNQAVAIQAVFGIGVETSPGTIRTTMFNGAAGGSFPTFTQTNCGTSGYPEVWLPHRQYQEINLATGEGQWNLLFITVPPIESEDNCIGFSDGALGGNYAEIRVTYLGELDCNSNGFPDDCDIAAGTSLDTNCNDVPDECECIGDLDGDGTIGAADMSIILGNWGACPAPCPADLDCSGDVGPADLAIILGNWGPCP